MHDSITSRSNSKRPHTKDIEHLLFAKLLNFAKKTTKIHHERKLKPLCHSVCFCKAGQWRANKAMAKNKAKASHQTANKGNNCSPATAS